MEAQKQKPATSVGGTHSFLSQTKAVATICSSSHCSALSHAHIKQYAVSIRIHSSSVPVFLAYSVNCLPKSSAQKAILHIGGGKMCVQLLELFYFHFPSNKHIYLKEWLTVNYGYSNVGIGEIFSQKRMKLASRFQGNNCHNLLAMMELKLESIIKIQENLVLLLWARQHPST